MSVLKWGQRSLGSHSTSLCLSHLPLEPLPEAAIWYSGPCYCSSHCFRVYLCVTLLWACSPLTASQCRQLCELSNSQYLISLGKKNNQKCADEGGCGLGYRTFASSLHLPDHLVNGLIWPGHVPGSSPLCDHRITQVGAVGVGMLAGAEWGLPLLWQ